jgi:hypothetical protein
MQGASIAAVLCAMQQQHERGQPQLRFAILCSGYPSPVAEHRRLHADVGPISLPSLHVYGAAREDRQVGMHESEALQDHFDVVSRHTIEHTAGHIIPACKTVVAGLAKFLNAFAV